MGISHQTGSIVLRGKAWYGFYRKEVIDTTTETVRSFACASGSALNRR
jgi:hypothetical protein